MTRRHRIFPLLGLLVFLLPAPAALAGASVADLDARSKRELIKAAREYFNPEIEFLWEPKKNFEAQLDALRAKGMAPLKDIGLLRSIVYEGRHFKLRFDDKKYRDIEDVTDWKKTQGVYYNLKSEKLRFAYSEPRSYPNESSLDRRRPDPFPLLMAFHEERDLVDKHGGIEEYPGGEALARLYPKSDYGDLYEKWFLVAPIAPRAQFLTDDGSVDHRFSTNVLRAFLQRYHIDFQRIVLDGHLEAATLASIYAPIFAGLVLRGGDVPDAMVPNLSTIPIYVVGDKELAKKLQAAGHPNVTLGDAKGLQPWLLERKSTTPKKFSWRVLTGEHRFAHWIYIGSTQFGPEYGIDVEVLDTEENPNTIKIDGKGVEQIALFLNDDVVDLDRNVRLLLNGQVRDLGKVKRDLTDLFQNKITDVRKSMIFVWLYPAFVPDIRMPPPKKEEASPSTAPDDVVGTPEDESKARKYWDKALEAETAGDVEKARALYQLVVDVGPTSYHGKAVAKLESLKDEAAGETEN